MRHMALSRIVQVADLRPRRGKTPLVEFRQVAAGLRRERDARLVAAMADQRVQVGAHMFQDEQTGLFPPDVRHATVRRTQAAQAFGLVVQAVAQQYARVGKFQGRACSPRPAARPGYSARHS